MAIVFGLALILFTRIWSLDLWQERVGMDGPPWEEPFVMMIDDSPLVTFEEEVAPAVKQFVDAVCEVYPPASKANEVYQARTAIHSVGRKAWKDCKTAE